MVENRVGAFWFGCDEARMWVETVTNRCGDREREREREKGKSKSRVVWKTGVQRGMGILV